MSRHAENRSLDRFDPFGERLETPRAVAMAAPARRTGAMGLALFWAVALLLLAGRLTLPVAVPSNAAATASATVLQTGSLR